LLRHGWHSFLPGTPAAGHDDTVASVAVPFISTPTSCTALGWACVASGQTTTPLTSVMNSRRLTRDFCPLLRARRERPRSRCAAEQGDEGAAPCMSRKEHCEG